MNERKIILLREYKELPYTCVGNTCLLPEFRITLTYEGLKTIVDKMKKDDLLRITVRDKTHNDYEIILS